MSQNSKKFFFVLLLFLGIFFPLHYAHAFVTALANLIIFGIPFAIINVILAISNIFLMLSTVVLNWILSENFIAWTFTGPDNPIVSVGWRLTRDLTNMFFVIALAFIGLATALKIKEYQMQKTLPLLIVIALLINFTPVICGVIIDATNIIMNFFLEKLTGMDLLNQQFTAQGSIILGAIKDISNPIKAAGRCLQALVMIIFNIVAILIFVLFAGLFAARYVALWILVILSPLAFFSYILPITRGFWKKWWNMFTQWCLTGITAAFFLYLGNHMLVEAPQMIKVPPPTAGILASFWIEFLNTILPYGIALVFLIIGFLQAIAGGAIGATMITKAVKGWAVKGVDLAKKKGGAWAKEKGWEVARKPLESERVQKAAARMARRKGWGPLRPIATVGRAIGRIGPAMIEAQIREMGEAEKAAGNKTPETNIQEIKFGTTKAKRIGSLLGSAGAGQVSDLKDLGLSDKEIIDLGQAAKKIHPGQRAKLAKFYPHLGVEMGMELTDKDREKGYESVLDKLVATAGPKVIEKWDESVILRDDVQEAMHKFWGGREVSAAARQFGRVFVDEFMKGAEERKLDWYLQRGNFGIPLYLAGNAAQNLDLRPLEGMGRAEVREKIRAFRAGAEPSEEAPPAPPLRLNQLRQELRTIETGNWRKTITPEQMRERRRIRTEIRRTEKEIRGQEKQEIKINKLYNKIPSVPDKETQNVVALEEILAYSELPRRFNVDTSKKGQPGPAIEIGKKTVNVHPDFLDEMGQVFDESKSEQERKQILGSLVKRVQTEKQKQTKEKRTQQVKAAKAKIGTVIGKIEETIKKAGRKARRKEVSEELIKELEEIAAKAEELANLLPEELEERESEIKELEERRNDIEKQLGKT